MGWKAIARSAVGTSHQKQKIPIPCQDCGNYRIFKDVIVGAVADGAGPDFSQAKKIIHKE